MAKPEAERASQRRKKKAIRPRIVTGQGSREEAKGPLLRYRHLYEMGRVGLSRVLLNEWLSGSERIAQGKAMIQESGRRNKEGERNRNKGLCADTA